MARLPIPGNDDGTWGSILNDYLSVEHNTDGTLKRGDDIDTALSTATAAQSAADDKIAKSLVTTKGDLIVASANAAANRLAAGTNGQYLAADSSKTLGLAWKNTQWLLASDFGAKFDGSTDDAAALQAAIDAAISSGKPLALDPGTTIIGTSLSISAPLTIAGAGQSATTLKAADALNDYVFSFTGGNPGEGIVGAYFASFTIDGHSSAQTSGGGILANGAVQCTFERIHFTSCYDWGLKLGPISGGAFGHHNRVMNCLFDQGGGSAGFGGGAWLTSSDENWFMGTDFEYLGGASAPIGSTPVMLYDQAGLQHIIGCNFVQGSHNCIGIRVQNAFDTKILSSTFDGLAGDCIFLVANKCVVSGNLITGPGDAGDQAASGIHLEFNTHFNVISGNSLETSNTVAGRVRSLIREEATGGSADNLIEGNSVTWGTYGPTVGLIESGGTNTIVRNNIGWKTENGGTATIADGTTSIDVNHGLDATPSLGNIAVTPTNSLGNAAKFWISGVTNVKFTINVDADPGASTATFSWLVRL
ncbi:MAG TPA: glycosyl hydrolase family 28-related protein [Candidatus Saccharimonadales bacterium]|nr:glycosyl hydrolase family 28-related protein [Candidatus Saccharimonadales bacterium]